MATLTQPRPPGPHEGPEVESLAPLESSSEEELLQTDREEMRNALERQCSVPELMRLLPKAVRVTRKLNGHGRPSHMMAWELIELLRQLASGGGSREAADVLLGLLETGQLEGLSAFRGPTCRSVAVETLLRLGFPYALEVRPEDLKHLRRQKLWRKFRRDVPWPLAVTVLSLGLVGQWLTLPPGCMTRFAGWAVVAVMWPRPLGLMAGMILAVRRSPSWVLGAFLLLVSSLLPLWMDPSGLESELADFGRTIGAGTGLLALVMLCQGVMWRTPDE